MKKSEAGNPLFQFVFATFLALFLLPHQQLFAKDLTSRLGVGVKNNSSRELPAMAAVYWPTSDLALTSSIGIDTEKNQSMFAFNLGVRRVLFKETNMNFYFGGQAGMVNFETGGVKDSGFELNVIYGAEFFLQGLDSIGFTFEGGVGVASLKEVRFRTVADHPFRAGIIFYF